MQRKIPEIILDIVLIVVVLFLTNTLVLKLLDTTSIWIYIAVYIALYALLFGAKRGILNLWARRRKAPAKDDPDAPGESN